ncbi:hypothetical protein SAMN05216419_100624 [Nitrosomonas cryotolerans]|uniref:UPF0235 protein SAMN02743940_2229 n=1 Tax=Nitrosomonas cryotolerans ATCC 49181 TaxID=1131553 RepID=A0A1N6J0W1_9PROT|nr:DUF167 family protein [Nitrosomonas cryotolerans]SFP53881.1 hypothetical protein SAMN05216419_100624 [Nitrosomonas cryotolerans]SIO37940.1 hypothetical protein SAMN02743940_2229 [Nitrosomonas cryotolerans ATCC 49181]
MSWYRSDNANNLFLTLHIQTGARCTEVVGLHGNALKIKLAAPPVEGKANAALLRFLAKNFNVPLCQVTLKQGHKSRHKVIKIQQSAHEPNVLFK